MWGCREGAPSAQPQTWPPPDTREAPVWEWKRFLSHQPRRHPEAFLGASPPRTLNQPPRVASFFFCFVLFYKSLMKAAECSESSVGETPILQMRKQGHMASKHRVGVEPPSLLARSVHSPQDTSWTSHMGVAGGRIGRWVTSEVLVEGASWLAPWVVPS